MSVRKYGTAPFRTAVIHGGPGAPGYMAPVARVLAETAGTLEPLQSEDSLDRQIEELAEQLRYHGDPPMILIGSSWGAVLALFVAAREETLAKKLILIGSAVFDAASSAKIESLRIARFNREKRLRYDAILDEMKAAENDRRDSLFKEWADMIFDSDVYDPLTRDLEVIEAREDLNKKVWADFKTLRDKPGFLKQEFSRIKIPVRVIHGDYDPHPIEGIRPFLEECLENVRFYILPRCGHYPWIEKHARERFFEIINAELAP